MMVFHDLSERERQVLSIIIQAFVMNAAPVGSRYIAKNYNLGLSDATIRNVMADLEDEGYISQPHTSAGRVPTDKGYRYYVDLIMRVQAVKRRIRTSGHGAVEFIEDNGCPVNPIAFCENYCHGT